MNKCRGRDQRIAFGARVQHVEGGAALRDHRVDRQDPSREGRQDLAVDPAAQDGSLRRTAAVDQAHTGFELEDGDGREE